MSRFLRFSYSKEKPGAHGSEHVLAMSCAFRHCLHPFAWEWEHVSQMGGFMSSQRTKCTGYRERDRNLHRVAEDCSLRQFCLTSIG